MRKFSLKFKLILSFLLAGLLPMILVGGYAFYKSTETLKKEAIDKLVAVRDIKGDAVKRYFNGIRDQILTFSHDVMIEDAMVQFSQSFKNFSSQVGLSQADQIVHQANLKDFYSNEFASKYKKENEKTIDAVGLLNQLSPNQKALQYHYIGANPNPLGGKEALDKAQDGSDYSRFHSKYHPSIREFLQKFGYYDIFLVDIESGEIVYSVFKELDYATSLLRGPYAQTNFADAFKRARDIQDRESFILVDYKQYTPSYEAPASFIAAPIWSGEQKVGVAMFQMPIDRLNTIMNQRSGMGETGETYLFGSDQLMRSDSYHDAKNFNVISSFKNPEQGKLVAPSVEEVLKGKSGNAITSNYLGEKVISAYTPIDILGLKWGLIADINTDEAFAPVNSIKNAMILILGLSSLAIALFAFVLSSTLPKKIQSIAARLRANAEEVATSSDRISSSSSQLSEAATEAASSLQETVSSIDEISSMIQRNADAASNSTQVSSKSSEAANRGKKTVETMIESINNIAQSNDEIAQEMQRNNEDISKIVQVIAEIGEKTKVINDIVFQTKLLSFNASVEAARAGEHGKGFAVVAEEVGNLASMSGKAALEITEMLDSSIKQVTDIVEKTKKKVEVLVLTSKEKVEAGTKTAHECEDSLDEILQNVTSVNEMVREIASASNEQSTGVQEVTKAMQQLDQTTHQNTTVAQESSSMAKRLKNQAEGLNDAVIELMAVVTGSRKVLESPSQAAERGEEVHQPKVLKMPRREHPSTSGSSAGIKVSGLDTEIPDESDHRFEDL